MSQSKKKIEYGPSDVAYTVRLLTAWQFAEDYATRSFRNLERETLDGLIRKELQKEQVKR